MTHPPVIQVSAIYEDLEAGIRAKALMDCVQSGLGLPAQCKLDLWRFDWLGELSMRNMALSIAKSSTLVLVSASTNKPFPVEMDRWMRAWMQSREHDLSAVVLLAPKESPGCHSLQASLQRVAEQKGVQFFCEFFKASPAEHSPVTTWRSTQNELNRPHSEAKAILPALIPGPPPARVAGLRANAFR